MNTPPAADSVVTFAEGLPGFERYREFVVVAPPDLQPFTVLQGVGAGGPSFVAVDPRVIDPSYDATLDAPALARLSVTGSAPLLWLAIVAANPDGTATANLRAPVVINPGTMQGIQVISADSRYPVDYPLEAA
jgi:flagellar assembly factor FliW